MSVTAMSKFPSGVPDNAIEVTFKFGRNMDGTFHVWPTKSGKWQWQAFGNNGEAPSQNEAIAQARDYIMYNHDPLNHN